MQNRNVLKLFPQPLIHYKFEDYKEQNIELLQTIANSTPQERIDLLRKEINILENEIALINDKKNNSEEALKFYNESIELETDNIKKARILYKIATKFKNTKQFFRSRNYQEYRIWRAYL